ncbi:MAG: hypothetical protein K8W52_27680 [Deltaproteobacteria bacterium]|nr:hypothetical protein [Deltaproteobacteria bacterium]
MKALRKMYRLTGSSMFQGEFARFEQCLSSDKQTLELEATVDPYDFCPAKTDLAPTIEKVDVTIPSDAE